MVKGACLRQVVTMPNPLQRPPLRKVVPPASKEWQEAFYVTRFHEIHTVNLPAYVPMSGTHSGPYSTYDAAKQQGEKDDTCSHFTIDKVWVHPGIRIHFKDQPDVLQDEYDDTSQFADDVPGLTDAG